VRQEGAVEQAAREVLLGAVQQRRTPAALSAPSEAARSSRQEGVVNQRVAKDLRALCSERFGKARGQFPANLYRRVKRAYNAMPAGAKYPPLAVHRVTMEQSLSEHGKKKGRKISLNVGKMTRKQRRRMGF
jgi:hypothetical protein